MAIHTSTSRLALRAHVAADRTTPYGARLPGSRRSIRVISPDTPPPEPHEILDDGAGVKGDDDGHL